MANPKPFKPEQKQDDNPARTEKKTSLLKLVFIAAVTLAILAAIISFITFRTVKSNYTKSGPLSQETVITVASGTGLSSLAAQLEKDGLIESALMLKLNARLSGIGRNLKVGEYTIPKAASMSDIIEIVSTGKSILYPVTVPEGLTTAQILRLISAADHLTGEVTLSPSEGTLLPETYMTPRGMDRDALIKKMMSDQEGLITRLWETRQDGLPIKTKSEAIILASVVEKETGVGGERAEVAGVFTNRLRRGMRLQSDPTIIYGINKGEILIGRNGKQRGLRRSEIDRKTDWNTYQIDGLPKTAICNPGADALAAVMQPAQTKNLYFVADGTGGHAFASTLAGHNANVAKWRKIERARRRGQ